MFRMTESRGWIIGRQVYREIRYFLRYTQDQVQETAKGVTNGRLAAGAREVLVMSPLPGFCAMGTWRLMEGYYSNAIAKPASKEDTRL